MLYIKRNSNNKLVVTVSEHKTLTSPNYLFSFEHIMSKEKVRFFPKNISTTVGRYDEFEFNEGQEPSDYTGDVPFEVFPYEGQYYYSVYECFTTGSTDPKYAFDKLEEGRAEVEDETIPSPYETFISSNEGNDNFIYYGEGINDERTLISFGLDLTNTETGSYNWSVAYPSTYYKDLGTGVVREFENNLYNQTGCQSTYLQVSGDTFFIEITTGATWSGFKLYYDQDDVISKGYNYLGSGYSGLTFNNFRPSFLPDRWFVDVTEHNIDGSTSTSSTLWSKDTNTPLNRTISQITGNTGQLYTIQDNTGSSGTTFSEVCSNYYGGTAQPVKLYYPSTTDRDWYINTGSTHSYSLTECIETNADSNFFVGKFSAGLVYVGSANTTGDIVFFDTCIPPSPTPSPTPSVTITPTTTPSVTITPTVTPSVTPSLTPTSSITPTPSITPTSTITPTPSITPTSTITPTPTPSPSQIITYNLLTEGGDTITTEGNDPIRTEQE